MTEWAEQKVGSVTRLWDGQPTVHGLFPGREKTFLSSAPSPGLFPEHTRVSLECVKESDFFKGKMAEA